MKNVLSGEALDLKVLGLYFAIGHEPATKFLDGQLEVDSGGSVVMIPEFLLPEMSRIRSIGRLLLLPALVCQHPLSLPFIIYISILELLCLHHCSCPHFIWDHVFYVGNKVYLFLWQFFVALMSKLV